MGITDYAQDALGDIVYVSLPEVGVTLTSGSACGELESTKSVSDVYAPVGGEVVARNEALDATPELVNSDPYGDGWLFEIVPADAELTDSLDAAGYQTRARQLSTRFAGPIGPLSTGLLGFVSCSTIDLNLTLRERSRRTDALLHRLRTAEPGRCPVLLPVRDPPGRTGADHRSE